MYFWSRLFSGFSFFIISNFAYLNLYRARFLYFFSMENQTNKRIDEIFVVLNKKLIKNKIWFWFFFCLFGLNNSKFQQKKRNENFFMSEKYKNFMFVSIFFFTHLSRCGWLGWFGWCVCMAWIIIHILYAIFLPPKFYYYFTINGVCILLLLLFEFQCFKDAWKYKKK